MTGYLLSSRVVGREGLGLGTCWVAQAFGTGSGDSAWGPPPRPAPKGRLSPHMRTGARKS